MDLEKYQSKYNNLSVEELEKIRDESGESLFEFIASTIHDDREMVKNHGNQHLAPQPLLQVLSISVHSNNDNKNKPLMIYGKIHAEYRDSGNMVVHDLYDRERCGAEILSTTGNLTLISPDCFSCHSEYACIPLFRSRIKLMLFDGADNVFANQCFYLDDEIDMEDNCDLVKAKLIHCELGSITFKYIAIPFGINCRIEVLFCDNRQASTKHESINVNGKVVVRYGNTHGNYSSEECVLFKKQENDFERVEFDEGNLLQLSRCWVSMPAYSSLAIGVNLLEFETKQEIVNDSLEFVPQQAWMSCRSFVSGDIKIQVLVAWFSPKPMGQCRATCDYHFLHSQPVGIPAIEMEERNAGWGISTEEIKLMDTESSDNESDDSFNLDLPWSLRPHRIMALSSPAIEIFSVFIGREKSKAIEMYGSIDVLSDNRGICSIFKRNGKDPLVLPEGVKSLDIPDGCRLFENFNPLEMKFDIKDVEGQVAIKGYVEMATSILDSSKWHEKQLCSFIQGLNGFAAIHYSIFSEAVGAYLKVFLNLKLGDADLYPKVGGSVIAEYSCYDYSSRYSKNYFRSMLFRKARNDPIQLCLDSSIPLSRHMVVVPLYSSLVVDVDLDFEVSDQKFSCAEKIEIEIGEGGKTLETNECFIRIDLDWCEIK